MPQFAFGLLDYTDHGAPGQADIGHTQTTWDDGHHVADEDLITDDMTKTSPPRFAESSDEDEDEGVLGAL